MRRLCLGLLALTACSDPEPVLLLPDLPSAKSALAAIRVGGSDFSFVAFEWKSAGRVENEREIWLLSYEQSLSELGLAPGPIGTRVVGTDCTLLEPTVHLRGVDAGPDWNPAVAPESLIASLFVEGRRCTNCIDFDVQARALAEPSESRGGLSAVRALDWLSDGSVLAQQVRGMTRATPDGTELLSGCAQNVYTSLSPAGPDRFWAWAPRVGEAHLIEVDLSGSTCTVMSSTASPQFGAAYRPAHVIAWPRGTSDGFLLFSEDGVVERFEGAWSNVGRLPEFQPGEVLHEIIPVYRGDEAVIASGGWERVSTWTPSNGLTSELVGSRVKIDAVGYAESVGVLAAIGDQSIGILRRDTGWQPMEFTDPVEEIRVMAPFRDGFIALYDFGKIAQYDSTDGFCEPRNDAQTYLGDGNRVLVSDSAVFVVARPPEPDSDVPRAGLWYTAPDGT